MRSASYKALNHVMGKALNDYAMIEQDDRIAVGLSGGKDSWALLWLLTDLQRRAPIRFALFPIHIDPGFEGGAAQVIARHGREIGHEVRIEHTDDGLVAHSDANGENPCFLCSRLRRKRLFAISSALDCSKLALAHNKDDLIETFFLNICYAGQTSTMTPFQPLFKGRLKVIRPLAYANEEALGRFAIEMGWPVIENPCPSAGNSQRSEVKKLLHQLYSSNKKIKGNIFRAMSRVKVDYLLKQK
jgi:tRNA 2-thiocytidine biosynthesis protein TtcA